MKPNPTFAPVVMASIAATWGVFAVVLVVRAAIERNTGMFVVGAFLVIATLALFVMAYATSRRSWWPEPNTHRETTNKE